MSSAAAQQHALLEEQYKNQMNAYQDLVRRQQGAVPDHMRVIPAPSQDQRIAAEAVRLEAQLGELRGRLMAQKAENERLVKRITRLEGEASMRNLERPDPRVEELRYIAECAMRYVKVQSARYQRELMDAIDKLERTKR